MRRLSIAVLLCLAACSKQPVVPTPRETPSPVAVEASTTRANETVAPVTSGPRVVFPNGFTVRVEPVADDEMRAQGLMYRDHLEPASGMLFLFPEEGVYSFWMKNTRIPLDMIWIDSSKRIVHIKSDVPPCTIDPCPSYDPGTQARYVLEVAGGESAKRGFRVGDVLRFEGMDHLHAR